MEAPKKADSAIILLKTNQSQESQSYLEFPDVKTALSSK